MDRYLLYNQSYPFVINPKNVFEQPGSDDNDFTEELREER